MISNYYSSDPIIEKILSTRNIKDDELSPSDEIERRNRMHTMLKSSKRYKRLALQRANENWDKQVSDTLGKFDRNGDSLASVIRDCDSLASVNRYLHVSFSDSVEIIPSDAREIYTSDYESKHVARIFGSGQIAVRSGTTSIQKNVLSCALKMIKKVWNRT